jgi:hypothetical protein
MSEQPGNFDAYTRPKKLESASKLFALILGLLEKEKIPGRHLHTLILQSTHINSHTRRQKSMSFGSSQQFRTAVTKIRENPFDVSLKFWYQKHGL